MVEVVLNPIPFDLNVDLLLHDLHIKPGSDDAGALADMAATAQSIARPKALCRVGLIDHAGEDAVVIEGVTLSSRVLRVNLDGVHRAFVFVATCGVELEAWAAGVEGLLERFWADAIMEQALEAAINTLREHITTRYHSGRVAMMNPGSLDDWPLSEQRALFDVLGDPASAIGVQLTDSFLMRPTKSVSGILFASEDTFESCQLCPLEDCPNRRAPHDASLYEQKYRSAR